MFAEPFLIVVSKRFPFGHFEFLQSSNDDQIDHSQDCAFFVVRSPKFHVMKTLRGKSKTFWRKTKCETTCMAHLVLILRQSETQGARDTTPKIDSFDHFLAPVHVIIGTGEELLRPK